MAQAGHHQPARGSCSKGIVTAEADNEPENWYIWSLSVSLNSNDRRPRWAARIGRSWRRAGASGVIVFNHGVLRAVSGGGHRTSLALAEEVTGRRPADRIYPADPTAPCVWDAVGACCYCELRPAAVAAVD